MIKTIEDAVRETNGEWPFGPSHSLMYWDERTETYVKTPTGYSWWCTRTEFEECTKKLRNEPSFDDHSDAKCFVQNDDGEWYKNTNTTNGAPSEAGNWRSPESIYGWKFASTGEVIGDWKDSLRLRPEEEKMDTTDTLLSSYRKALEKVLEDSKCGVVPKSHLEAIEDLLDANQKEDKRDWHKKGEFPPVGTVCEMQRGLGNFTVVTITYVSNDLIAWRFQNGQENSICPSYCKFRPLQTERERLIEKALNTVKDPLSKEETIFQLVDAGMLKMPEGK